MTFKEATQGTSIFALFKTDEIKYSEGVIAQVGVQRTEMPKSDVNQFPMSMPQMRQVVDVTYTLDGQTFTDAVDIGSSSFITQRTGATTLISTDKDAVLRELNETLKQAEGILKDVPKLEKRVKKCKELIGKLDTASAEKQAMEKRLTKMEEQSKETNTLLKQLLEKMSENKLF